MKKYLNVTWGSLLAGALIGIGATVYLSVLPLNKIAAAFLFAFGLFTIIQLDLYLYTGKVGFVFENKPNYLLQLLLGLVGNFVGIVLFCLVLKWTRIGGGLQEQAAILVAAKQGDKFYSILLLAFACGIMVYLAVKGHRVAQYPLAKALICFFAVAVFVLCGFEHCIANAAYYVYAGVFGWKALGYFALMIAGNSLGAIAMDGLLKLFTRTKNDSLQNIQQ